jgi:hypothetical protein
MLTPRSAVTSDAPSRVHGSGILTETVLLDLDVVLVEDGDTD